MLCFNGSPNVKAEHYFQNHLSSSIPIGGDIGVGLSQDGSFSRAQSIDTSKSMFPKTLMEDSVQEVQTLQSLRHNDSLDSTLELSVDGHSSIETISSQARDSTLSQDLQSLMASASRNGDYHEIIRIFGGYTYSDGGIEIPSHPQLPVSHLKTSTLNYYLEALVHLGYIREIEDAVTLYEPASDRQPDKRTYVLLLKAYIRSLNLRKARLLLFEMIDRGVKIDGGVVRIILGGEGRWAISLESIDGLLNLLSSLGLELGDIISYNIIMAAYLRRDRPDKARAVLDTVTKHGLHPDAQTFLALMRYQAKKEGSKAVSILLNLMTKSGIAAGLKHLNVLVLALARERRMDLSTTVEVLSPYNLSPDIVTCNIVLRSLLRRNFISQDLDTHFEGMKKLNVFPDVYTFTILLNEYKRKSRRWQRSRKVLRHQFALNPRHVNQVTDNVVIHQMISNLSHPTDGCNSIRTDKPHLHFQWDLHTVTTRIVAYTKSRDWSKIGQLHRKLQMDLVKLDRYCYRILFHALLKGKLYEESKEIISILHTSDDILDQMFGRECKIHLAIDVFRRTGQEKANVVKAIDNFLKFCDEKEVMLSDNRCNLVAVACLAIRQQSLTIRLLESRFQRRGRFQDLEDGRNMGMSSWTILMRAYARKGKDGIEDLRSCVDRALSDCLEPPTRAFLNFLDRLGNSRLIRSSNPEDADYFLEKRRECVKQLLSIPAHARRKGRSVLTKTRILSWVNNLNEESLRQKLRVALDIK
jgi:pentatricopeptide repeat protein